MSPKHVLIKMKAYNIVVGVEVCESLEAAKTTGNKYLGWTPPGSWNIDEDVKEECPQMVACGHLPDARRIALILEV